MRKYITISSIVIISIIILVVIFLSTFGIKTKQFNSFIDNRIKEFNSKLTLETNDIFLKVNLIESSVKIKTRDARIKINNESISLSTINIDLDLIKFIKKENSIRNISIVSEQNKINDVTKFINNYKFNIPRLIIFNQIDNGIIRASVNISLDDKRKNNFSLEINGEIKDASLNILNKNKVNNINFNFNIKDDLYILQKVKFNYENVEYRSDQIEIKKSEKNFFVKGNINNEKSLIDPKLIFNIFDLNQDFIKKDEKILIGSDTVFSFKINPDKSLDDLSINSNLSFEKIYFDNEIQNFLIFKNGNIKFNFDRSNLKMAIDAEYFLVNQNYNNNIKINIEKKLNEKTKVYTIFKTEKLKINTKDISKFLSSYDKIIKNQNIILDSDNKISFFIDNRNEIEKLKINSLMKINQFEIKYNSDKIKKFLPEFNEKVIFQNNNIELDYADNEIIADVNGDYSLKEKFDKYKIAFSKKIDKYFFDTFIDIDKNLIVIDEIDYHKDKNLKSNIKVKGNYNQLSKNNKSGEFKFEDIIISDDKNKILISNLNLSSNFKVNDIDVIELNYINNNKNKNYLKLFKINNNYKLISDTFDGKSFISKILTGDSNKSFLKIFKNLNSEIFLSLDKLIINKKSYLNNIEGYLVINNNEIKSGKIDAILNKKNKFSYNLKNSSNNEKVTTILVDEPAPFIKNYKFIRGFEKGNLSYNSIEKNGIISSNMKIFNFKVKEVPLLAKLLSLASLQGIADLLTGEGIRFDEFEMQYETNKNITTFNEIYAIGPAISILMEGYVEKDKLTSLRGTLVPATTINKSIAKIPLLGNILVGKDVGEGVFGVSFKIKGPPKNLKTTVNPVKTLTPRFITRTLEKLKKN